MPSGNDLIALAIIEAKKLIEEKDKKMKEQGRQKLTKIFNLCVKVNMLGENEVFLDLYPHVCQVLVMIYTPSWEKNPIPKTRSFYYDGNNKNDRQESLRMDLEKELEELIKQAQDKKGDNNERGNENYY